MTHLVFGTGLVGGYLAGALILQGFDARLLGRPKHEKAMRNGLTLTSIKGFEQLLSAPVFLRSDENLKFDFIWLTVKCTAVESTIDELKKLVKEDTVILCCQNGFASDEPLRAAFADNVVLNAVVGFNVAERSGNHLHRSTDGSLVVESHNKTDPIIKKLNCDLLPAHSSSDIWADRWAKLQLNLSNPVNALSDVPTKFMTENSGYRKIIAALMRELLHVTDKLDLALPKLTSLPAHWLPRIMELPNWVYLRLAQKMLAIDPTARQSMWWDLSQGRESEIMFINQAVVEQAQLLGIECPVNKKIIDLIKAVERGDEQIGFSAEQLQARLL